MADVPEIDTAPHRVTAATAYRARTKIRPLSSKLNFACFLYENLPPPHRSRTVVNFGRAKLTRVASRIYRQHKHNTRNARSFPGKINICPVGTTTYVIIIEINEKYVTDDYRVTGNEINRKRTEWIRFRGLVSLDERRFL